VSSARLQPGVTPVQAMAAAQPVDRRLAQEFPDSHKDVSLLVLPELDARPEPGLGGFHVHSDDRVYAAGGARAADRLRKRR